MKIRFYGCCAILQFSEKLNVIFSASEWAGLKFVSECKKSVIFELHFLNRISKISIFIFFTQTWGYRWRWGCRAAYWGWVWTWTAGGPGWRRCDSPPRRNPRFSPASCTDRWRTDSSDTLQEQVRSAQRCNCLRECLWASAYGSGGFCSGSLCPACDRDRRWIGPAAPPACNLAETSLCTNTQGELITINANN